MAGECSERLQQMLEQSPFWAHLMFALAPTPHGVLLQCSLFHPMLPDLKYIDVDYLNRLDVSFDLWTPRTRVYFDDVATLVDYLLCSVMLNLEYRFPFCFSYYGKQLVHVNYRHMLKNHTWFATPLDNSAQPNRNDMLRLVLRKLTAGILSEYNTLNIMKECDLHQHRRALCRTYVEGRARDGERRSIKAKAVSLRILAQ